MSRLEQTDRIARVTLIAAVAMACVSPFALGALKDADQIDEHVSARLFKHLDGNHDGALDWSEAHQVPGVAVVFNRADTDRDGRLSRSEFLQAQSMGQRLIVMPASGVGLAQPIKVKGALIEEQYLPSLALGLETL